MVEKLETEKWQLIRAQLERKLAAQQQPKAIVTWAPQAIGDSLLGMVIDISRYGNLIVQDSEGNKFYTPKLKAIQDFIELEDPQPGDFVLLSYEGTRKLGGGKKFKLIRCAKLSREEASKLGIKLERS